LWGSEIKVGDGAYCRVGEETSEDFGLPPGSTVITRLTGEYKDPWRDLVIFRPEKKEVRDSKALYQKKAGSSPSK